MLLSECHMNKSCLSSSSSQQPGWDVPIPSASAVSLQGHHGSPSSRETCLTLHTLPRNKGPGEAVRGAVNSALPLIKHLAVTEASQHASFPDTFTVWGNGVPGL